MYRKWTVEDKVQTIIQFYQDNSKCGIRAFCRQHKIPRGTFEGWIKKANNRTLSLDLRKNNGRKILYDYDK